MKRVFLVFAFVVGVSGLAFSLEAGGGISVFVPESLYLQQQGSVSVETNFQYALGISKLLSFPIGISYNKIYGYTPGGTPALDTVTSPWFFGDSIMGYVMAKVHLPISIFYLDIYGGGAGNWNVTLTPVGGTGGASPIESYLASQAGSNAVAVTGLSASAPWGYGWVAGAGFGVSIKKVRVDISATYRDIQSPLTMKADYYAVSSSGSTATVSPLQSSTLSNTAVLVMRGLSVGVNGHFSF